jgi:hypothetical protein
VTPLRSPRRPLPEVEPDHVCTWAPHDWMIRVYHAHPNRAPLQARTFGPLHRFDPHVRDRRQRPREQPDGRGTMYLTENLACALAESFPEQWPEVSICPSQYAVLAGPDQPAALLDLTGDGAMKIGAVATLGSGREPRQLTQRWGRAIYEDFPQLHGIRYRGAHQGGVCVVVWERSDALEVRPGTAAPGRQLLEPAMLDRVRVALSAQGRYPVAISSDDCPRCP